jgi:hypothetical protein
MHEEFCMVSDFPEFIHVDSENRPHCTTGPYIKWRDGFCIYMIHGVKFTEEQFERAKTATVSEILSWEDIDQRSVLLRERPLDELLATIPKKLIDHTEECGGYDLYEIELNGIGKAKILSYTGWSSEKPYVKFAPSDSINALEAVASLRHQTVEELKSSLKS